MTSIQPASMILALETVVVLLAIGAIAAYWFYRQRKLDQTALGTLVRKIKERDQVHRTVLRETLSSTYRMEGDELAQSVDAVVEKERDIYRAIVGIYRHRDRERLIGVVETVEAMTTAGLALVQKTREAEYLHDIQQLKDQIAEAERAHEMTQDELSAIKGVLDGLTREYAAAFDKDGRKQLSEKLNDAVAVSTAPVALEARAEAREAPPAEEPVAEESPKPPRELDLFGTLEALDAALDVKDWPNLPDPPAAPEPAESVADSAAGEPIIDFELTASEIPQET